MAPKRSKNSLLSLMHWCKLCNDQSVVPLPCKVSPFSYLRIFSYFATSRETTQDVTGETEQKFAIQIFKKQH